MTFLSKCDLGQMYCMKYIVVLTCTLKKIVVLMQLLEMSPITEISVKVNKKGKFVMNFVKSLAYCENSSVTSLHYFSKQMFIAEISKKIVVKYFKTINSYKMEV